MKDAFDFPRLKMLESYGIVIYQNSVNLMKLQGSLAESHLSLYVDFP